MDLANEVKQDIENRIIKGIREYGERLKPFNGRDALLDAYEECLDQALYLKQELTEKQAIQMQAKVIVNFAERDRKLLTHFLNSIRDYERESHNLIGTDERETSEFIDIYFENDYSKISE